VSIDFQAPEGDFVALDHFEELPAVPHDKTVNSAGGPVSATDMTYEEQFFAFTQPTPRNTYKGETYGGYLLWSTSAADFASSFPSPVDVGDATHLSFRVGQIYRSSGSPNPPGADQDFSVVVQLAAAVAVATDALPTMTDPPPGTVLDGATDRFEWTDGGTQVDEWWLYLGSSVGSSDILTSGSLGLQTSLDVSGIPTDGRQIFVRLWYRQGSTWKFEDFQYTAAVLASIRVSDFAPIHPPFSAYFGGIKTVMSVVRIPLTVFGTTPESVSGIQFFFDQLGMGEIVIDDIRFTK
jgi:hypothetical protein